VNSRKKPGVAFWATVAVVAALVGYPLSWGPVCWIRSDFLGDADWAMEMYFTIYGPLLWIDERAPDSIQHATAWYCNLL
jgi:hypothetical protein